MFIFFRASFLWSGCHQRAFSRTFTAARVMSGPMEYCYGRFSLSVISLKPVYTYTHLKWTNSRKQKRVLHTHTHTHAPTRTHSIGSVEKLWDRICTNYKARGASYSIALWCHGCSSSYLTVEFWMKLSLGMLFVPGGSPYPDVPLTQEFYSSLKRGYRMNRPEHAPQSMYGTCLQVLGIICKCNAFTLYLSSVLIWWNNAGRRNLSPDPSSPHWWSLWATCWLMTTKRYLSSLS